MAPEIESRIIDNCIRGRLPLPDKIKNAPELNLGLELYYGAFLDLNTCRPVGMGGVSPIPWTSIQEYAIVYELDEEQTDALFYLIRRMDSVFIDHVNKQKPKPEKPVRRKR